VQVKRRTEKHPLGSFEMTRYEGFNGSEPIHEVAAPALRSPRLSRRTEAGHACGDCRGKAKLVNQAQRAFARFVTPLFASSTSAYPLKLTGAGQATLPSGAADVLEVTGPDGATFRLFLDAASHLPVQLTGGRRRSSSS
jgi:hypothetical protein